MISMVSHPIYIRSSPKYIYNNYKLHIFDYIQHTNGRDRENNFNTHFNNQHIIEFDFDLVRWFRNACRAQLELSWAMKQDEYRFLV